MKTESNALIEPADRSRETQAVLKIQQLSGDEATIAALKIVPRALDGWYGRVFRYNGPGKMDTNATSHFMLTLC